MWRLTVLLFCFACGGVPLTAPAIDCSHPPPGEAVCDGVQVRDAGVGGPCGDGGVWRPTLDGSMRCQEASNP
jgi:hypothetical protein